MQLLKFNSVIRSLLVLVPAALVQAEWPTTWSGTLPRPVLFVHGIAADMSSWGAEVASKTCINPDVKVYSSQESTIMSVYWITVRCADGYAKEVSRWYAPTGINTEGTRSSVLSEWTGKSYAVLPGSWKAGRVASYVDNNSAMILAKKYKIDLAGGLKYTWTGSTSQVDAVEINHNGLEFYNSLNPGDELPSHFSWIAKTQPDIFYNSIRGVNEENQTSQLYRRMVEVLNEYYPDWKVNPARQIDMVCHSQGGLVTRSVIHNYPSTSLENPVNHIRSIVTLDTPHLGSGLATDNSGFPTLEKLRKYVYGLGEEVTISDNLYAASILGPYYIRLPQPEPGTIGYRFTTQPNPKGGYDKPGFYFVKGNSYLTNPRNWTSVYMLDPLEPARQIFNGFTKNDINLAYPSYPAGYSVPDWIPKGANFNPPVGTERSAFITALMNSGYPKRPYDKRKIPITAYSGWMDPGAVNKLVEHSITTAYNYCDGTPDNVTAWLAPASNFVTSFITLGLSGTNFKPCWSLVDELAPILRRNLNPLDEEWGRHTDLVVDISSQHAHKLFKPTDPFSAKLLRKKRPSDFGVPHMEVAGIGENGTPVQGATAHGEEIIEALENPPRRLNIVPALTLLSD